MKNFKKNVMYATVAVLALSGVTVKSNIFSGMWQKTKKNPAKAIGIGLGTAAVLGTAGYGTKKAYDYKKGLGEDQPLTIYGTKYGTVYKVSEFAGASEEPMRQKYREEIARIRQKKARDQELYGQAKGQSRKVQQDQGLTKKTSAEKVFGTERLGTWKGKTRGFATRHGF